MSKGNKPPKGENAPTTEEPTEWDGLAEAVDNFEKQRREMAPQRAKESYRNILGYQRSFEKRNATLKQSGERMSQKEFEKWEDLMGDELKLADREADIGNFTLEQKAEGEQYMITSADDSELHKTIEAQAGNFYYSRMADIKKAIEDAGGDKEEIKYLNEFYPTVVEHLDFKYMSKEEVRDRGVKETESNRTKAHNDVIKRINGVNDLARKYHVRPLTVRNFLPSDVRRKEDQTPAVSRVMRYDRDIIEEYYEIAFSREVQRREAIVAQQKRFGFY